MTRREKAKTSHPRRFTSILVLLVLAPLALDGCVSIGISRSALPSPEPATATLEVRIYESPGDRRKDLVSQRKIVSEIFLTNELLRTETKTVWSLSDLSPGDYRLVVPRWIDENGQTHALASVVMQDIQLRAGDKVIAAIVLKNTSVGTILIAAGLTLVIVVALVTSTAD